MFAFSDLGIIQFAVLPPFFKEILTSLRIPLRASSARSGGMALIRDSKGGQNLGASAHPRRILNKDPPRIGRRA